MRSPFLIIVLFFVASLANMNGLAFFPFLPTIADEFGTSVSVVGQAMTVSLIGGAIIGLVAGPLADHFGPRRFVILGSILMSISGAGTALAGSYEMLLLARFPAGLATGIMMGIGLSLATTRLSGDERRSAVSWIASGSALGAVVGPPLVTALATFGTWRTGFWFLAVAPIVLVFFCLRVISPDSGRPATPFRLLTSISDYRSVLADRRSLLLQSGTVLWAVPTVAGSGYFGAYLIESHGFSLTGVGLAYTWAAGWLMVGPRVAIWLLKYLDLHRLIAAAGIAMATAITTLFWLPLGMPWILLFMMIWTLVMGVGTPSITSAISEAARSGQSTAMMARQFSWTIGGAVGAALGGLLITIGGYSLFGFGAGMFGIAMTAVVLLSTRPEPALASATIEVPIGE